MKIFKCVFGFINQIRRNIRIEDLRRSGFTEKEIKMILKKII